MAASNFRFSRRSLRRLDGYHEDSRSYIAPVHPDLVDAAHLALQYSSVDFGIAKSTIRTLAEQEEFYRTRRSSTLLSNHLPQDDGFVHAIDVSGYDENGRYLRDFEDYFPIAEAFQEACFELGLGIRWGGSWMSLLEDMTPEQMADRYIERVEREFNLGRRSRNRPLLDGVHFELPREYR